MTERTCRICGRGCVPHVGRLTCSVRAGLLVALYSIVPPSTIGQTLAPPTVMVQDLPVHPAQYGGSYTSALAAGEGVIVYNRPAELWMFGGATGDCVTLTLRSPFFGPHVLLRQEAPDGPLMAEGVADPDTGSATVRVSLPAAGAYFIIVTSPESTTTEGIYTLTLTRC
jgi:hypothetical protein